MMRVLDESICRVCRGVFCCAECRYKHEIKSHAITVQKPIKVSEQNNSGAAKYAEGNEIYLFCPICENQPLILEKDLHKEMLFHIELFHLPLRCQKCLKTYSKVNDFKEFSKCFSKGYDSLRFNKSCSSDEASKITVTKAAMPHCNISQSTPSSRQDSYESHITPISVINMRWKARSKLHQEEFISDSVSSIKNISSINNSSSGQSTGIAPAAKGKVIRCSSTPVQLEMVFSKPKEQTFNASSGHMSSIQYNSGCESDISPSFPQASSQALEPANRYMKVAGSRPRMTAVTPLRQVMSKSIQKAFAEHGLPPSHTRQVAYTFQRKNMFDSNSSPEIDDERSPICPALDLRLSPAVRRGQSDILESARTQNYNNKEPNELPYLRREILLSSQKLTTESIVITRTEQLSSVSSSSSSTVGSNFSMKSVKPYTKSTNSNYESSGCNNTGGSLFKSCSSVEIITATTEEIHSFDKDNAEIQPNTPITRIHGSSINKKLIKFETPKIKLSASPQSPSSPNDEFFTPNSTPMHSSNEPESPATRLRKLSVKNNLSGTFSILQRPSIKECAHSTAFSRIENVSNYFDGLHENENVDDEVFVPVESEKLPEGKIIHNNENRSQKPGGLWSIMASVMRLPSFNKEKTPEQTSTLATCSSTRSRSNSLIKRCASIAGSLVRSKSLVDDNEFCSLKRKRTYTTDNQSTSLYLAELNNIGATSITSNLNASAKRFRIQGRKPIDRMRLNS